MAKPNYSFEKRQREIAKKKKKEEKLARKQEARDDARPADPPAGEHRIEVAAWAPGLHVVRAGGETRRLVVAR